MDGRIRVVGPSQSTRLPAGAEVLDAAGQALLPGLWDMEWGNGSDEGPLAIAAGITTVRLRSGLDLLDGYKKWDEGSTIGPRLVHAGIINGAIPLHPSRATAKISAETEDEALALVDAYAARGDEGIDLNYIRPELVPRVAQLAHQRGLWVSGDIPDSMNAEDAVRAGYDEIQGLSTVFARFLADAKRHRVGLHLVAEKAGELDLSSPAVKAFVRLLRERKTVLNPTMYGWERLMVSRPDQVLPGLRELVARLPIHEQRFNRTRQRLWVPAGKEQAFQRSYVALVAMLKLLHDAGVPIAAGTGPQPPGGGLTIHRELEIYTEAGLSPAEAIYTATLVPARMMKRERTSGSIAAGKDADLILIDGDPLADIRDLRRVATTIRGGVMYSSSGIYEAFGIRPLDPRPRP